MDKAKEFLTLNEEVVSETVSRLTVPPDRVGGIDDISSVDIVLKGIRVDRVQPGLIICSFPRLADITDNFATGAISYLVDALGGAVADVEGRPMNVSVDVSISFLSMAKPDRTMSIVPQKPYDTYRLILAWFWCKFVRFRLLGDLFRDFVNDNWDIRRVSRGNRVVSRKFIVSGRGLTSSSRLQLVNAP